MKESFLILKRLLESKLSHIDLNFQRFLINEIDWRKKVIWIYWERWIWKTYLMLQKLKQTWWFYFSCDNPIIQSLDLFKFIDFLTNDLWYEYIYIDEIHKYVNWINLIKSIYDLEFSTNIVFSGSSSLDLYKWSIDLWRRGKFYNLHTLNYFEFLNLFYTEKNKKLNFSFEDIIKKHKEISFLYWKKYFMWKFDKFLHYWFYPFSKTFSFDDFIESLQEVLKKVIIEDLPTFKVFKSVSLIKLQKIFYFIANNLPSDLSFLSLSKKVWVDKKIIEDVLFLLNKIWIVSLIPKFWSLSDIVRKEYKVFLWNPNLYYIRNYSPNVWIIRESFFISQIRKIKNIEIFSYSKWDFFVKYLNKTYVFEIWWKNKNFRQIKWEKNAYLIKDDIIVWEDNIIPLWLFSLL